MQITTPYYIIDEKRLLRNLQIMQQIREQSGAKFVLALKCFSTWSVFDLMRQYMDGTTSVLYTKPGWVTKSLAAKPTLTASAIHRKTFMR